jgi:hypothetical protein
MSPPNWAAIEGLFQRALDLNPEEREQFLNAECSDASIRQEVLGLLRSVADDDFLDRPALAGTRQLIDAARASNDNAMPSPVEPPSDLAGTVAGDRYRLIREIGRGAHGVVFLAADQRLSERKVVVKILDGAAEHQRWLQRRFRQEIEILAKISHPGVAGVRDCGEIRGQPYLVMDFVEGVTLREYMKRGLTANEVSVIVAQVGAALRAAHVQGVAPPSRRKAFSCSSAQVCELDRNTSRRTDLRL